MLQMERKPNISYVDPAICALINSLKDELEAMCKLVERQRDELEAVKFTPHSSVGLRLMAKCSALRAENEELGRLLQQGTIEKYQLENNLQRKLITELKSALNESNAYAVSLDREIEALQDELFDCKKPFN
ncbi:hypothetical protein VKS41_003805 [Umbelopsis sp. WA50703]